MTVKKMIACMCAMLLLVTACDKEKEPAHESNGDKLGVLFPTLTNQWKQAVLKYGLDYMTKLNIPYESHIATSGEQQEKAFADMVKRGFKTILLSDQGVSASTIDKAIADGVNVVLYDGEVECNYACYVTNSQEDMGKVPGEHIKKTKATNIVAIDVTSSPRFSKPRLEAFEKALGEGQKVTVVSVDAYTQVAGMKVIDQIAAINPDALWAQDDQILVGMLYHGLMEKATNIKHIASGTGFQPLLTIIRDEKLGKDVGVVTTTYSARTIEKAIDIASDLLKGKKPAEKKVIIPSRLITKDNVSEFINPDVVYY